MVDVICVETLAGFLAPSGLTGLRLIPRKTFPTAADRIRFQTWLISYRTIQEECSENITNVTWEPSHVLQDTQRISHNLTHIVKNCFM